MATEKIVLTDVGVAELAASNAALATVKIVLTLAACGAALAASNAALATVKIVLTLAACGAALAASNAALATLNAAVATMDD